MKQLFFILSLILFMTACSDSDPLKLDDLGKGDTNKEAKVERIATLEGELASVKKEIADIQASIQNSTGGVQIVFREQLQNKMHRKGEIEREIQKLKKELGVKSVAYLKQIIPNSRPVEQC